MEAVSRGRRAGIMLHHRTMVPVGLFITGVACIAGAVLTGQGDVSLFLVFPVFSGSSGLFLLGTVLIISSFVTGFMFLMMGQVELAGADLGQTSEEAGQVRGSTGRRYGGVVLIGPVPIAFGSDKNIALAMLVLGIVLAIALLIALAFLLG